MGIEKGGWGLYLRTVDMAKLGQLYLQRGRWETEDGPRQLLPESWVNDSTRRMVPTHEKTNPGYGYGLWSFPVPGAYQFNGVFGQYVVVLPHLDAVVAVTSGSQNFVSDDTASIIAEYFAPDAAGFHDAPLPQNLRALRNLKGTTSHLYALPGMAQPAKAKGFFERFGKGPEVPPLPRQADALEGHVLCIFRKPVRHADAADSARADAQRPAAAFRRWPFLFAGHVPIDIPRRRWRRDGLECGPRRRRMPQRPRLKRRALPRQRVGAFDERRGRPAGLKLSLCFLQTPCVRQMKFIFYRGESRVLVRFTEFPDVGKATEMLFHLVSGGGGTLQKMFSDAVRQQKLRGRLDAITRPIARGAEKEDESMPELF